MALSPTQCEYSRDRSCAFGGTSRAKGRDNRRAFLDAFDQHLALPPVFKREFNFVAFLGSEYRLAERRADCETAFFQVIAAFGERATEMRF